MRFLLIMIDTWCSIDPGLSGPINTPVEKEIFPPDIEQTANAYFQSVYTGQMSIDEIVNLLKNFKDSKNKRQDILSNTNANTIVIKSVNEVLPNREQKIFSCMIHNLFDEYRFFQKYPDKELRITGILFGQLIQNQLVSYISLGIALRYVLEALKKPPNSKMFKFGLFALQQFKSRLIEWPQVLILFVHLSTHLFLTSVLRSCILKVLLACAPNHTSSSISYGND